MSKAVNKMNGRRTLRGGRSSGGDVVRVLNGTVEHVAQRSRKARVTVDQTCRGTSKEILIASS